MSRFILFLLLAISSISFGQKTLYDYSALDIHGDTVHFSKFKGKKLLIVNTASECGLTPQYEKLEKLYQQYKDSNFVIVGFPANNFGAQEPGTNKEIAGFCTKNYGVTFVMMSKISVKGEDQDAIYQFLTKKSLNGVEDSEVKWNFQKYLISENGKLIKHLAPRTDPMSQEIIDWILN